MEQPNAHHDVSEGSSRLKPTAVLHVLFEYSGFLIAGAIAALLWANLDNASYSDFIHYEPFPTIWKVDIHFLVADLLMAMFFAIAAKEVWESCLPGGALSEPRRAATPLLATLGGIVGPAGVYLAGAATVGQLDALGRGWAIPCATDIAFCYLVARFIFGKGHPAISFLLLLAIADDAAGLAILAIAYPQEEVNLIWLLLTVAAVVVGVGFRWAGLQSFWWYILIPGAISWWSLDQAGLPTPTATSASSPRRSGSGRTPSTNSRRGGSGPSR